jgi:hypothetical protein
LASDPTTSPEVSNPASPENSIPPQRTGIDLWLHRISILIFVLLCAGSGVTLAILPWSLQWTDNYLLLRYPAIQPFVTNGFVRGVCTGLGLLDLWIGFAEAVHYHEEKPTQE